MKLAYPQIVGIFAAVGAAIAAALVILIKISSGAPTTSLSLSAVIAMVLTLIVAILSVTAVWVVRSRTQKKAALAETFMVRWSQIEDMLRYEAASGVHLRLLVHARLHRVLEHGGIPVDVIERAEETASTLLTKRESVINGAGLPSSDVLVTWLNQTDFVEVVLFGASISSESMLYPPDLENVRPA